MRRTWGALTIGALAVALAASGCSSNTGSDTGSGGRGGESKQQGGISKDPKDSQGPAKKPEGAQSGGTVTIVQQADFEHLDPARNYVTNQQEAMGLVYRQLTQFKDDGGGNLLLVGDMATDAGKDVSDGKCTKWEYTLKDGLKYEDGTDVKAADVAYGVARAFSPDLAEGPHYIQQWLADDIAYNKTYKGPYNGGGDVPPGVEVSGDKTITFTFPKPHCDMPFAAAMATSSAVPKSKDTKTEYDLRPFGNGPYKIKTHKKDTELTLERNQYWDPKTDPIRNNFPDAWNFTFGLDDTQQNERLLADNGADQSTISWANVPPELLPKVTNDANAKKRVVEGATQFLWVVNINMQRVKDLNVRKALNLAMDKQGMLQVLGGPAAGSIATTLMSPTTIGYKKYDAFPSAPSGDAAKAKQLLGGKTVKLTYGYSNTPRRQKQAAIVKESLEKAGFQIALNPIDPAQYYTVLGRKDNPYDIYLTGWGSDWPSGSTIIPPLYDGRSIVPQGNQNYSYINESELNSEIDRISALPADEATAEWAKLDEMIMTKWAPVVPIYNDKNFTLVGSKIGGYFLSDSYGLTHLWSMFVKK